MARELTYLEKMRALDMRAFQEAFQEAEKKKKEADAQTTKKIKCRICGTTLNVNRSTRLCGDCTHIVNQNAKNQMNERMKSMKTGIETQ